MATESSVRWAFIISIPFMVVLILAADNWGQRTLPIICILAGGRAIWETIDIHRKEKFLKESIDWVN